MRGATMCWGTEATVVMVAAGVAGAAVTWQRAERPAIPLTLLFFAAMEALQFGGYLVIDQCGSTLNSWITRLSLLHIALQPVVINAFMLALIRPDMGRAGRHVILGLAAAASAVIMAQMASWPGAPACTPGRPLCGDVLCTVSGLWHLAWTTPFADIFAAPERLLNTNFGFPTYVLSVFVMPLFWGAWRFALFHAAVGPVAAGLLTRNPNEAPAVWCLASILIIAACLIPPFRRLIAGPSRPAGIAAG